MPHSPPKERRGRLWLMLFVFDYGNGDLGTVFRAGPEFGHMHILTGIVIWGVEPMDTGTTSI